MREKEKLLIALTQIENVVTLLEDNEWKSYLHNHLSPVKYELERQLTNFNGNEETNKTRDRNS